MIDLQTRTLRHRELEEEWGSSGIEMWSGFVHAAYDSKLYWPGAYEILNQLRRADPEIGGIVRPAFTALGRGVKLDWMPPADPSDDDLEACDYGREVLDDLDGGSSRLQETIASYVPFMGWGWWEEVWGRRSKTWRPPDPEDEWRSSYDDGLPTIRRLAWRDHSSFERWDANEKTGRVHGFIQHDYPNPPVTIPRNKSLHLTFGDPESPEGLTPLEAVWRLDRLKYNYETIQALGFQHAAGYAQFQATAALSNEDKAYIREAARSLMSPQAGNFIRLPGHISAQIMDGSFSAATALLETIRYYGLLKLQIFSMQWAAIATTAGTGALATHSDSSDMSIMIYNAMWDGFAAQMDDQLGRHLFSHPEVIARFPGMTRRPTLIAIPIEKTIPLNTLSQFISQIAPIVPFGEDDLIAIRRKSGFLPEILPILEETSESPVPLEETVEEGEEIEGLEETGGEEESESEEIEEGELSAQSASRLYSAIASLLAALKRSISNEGLDED